MKRILILLLLCSVPLKGNAQQGSNPPIVPIKRTTIVAFGDSFMSEVGVDFYQSFTTTLERYLRSNQLKQFQIFNFSSENATSKELDDNVNKIIKLKPNLVLLGIGADEAMQKKEVNSIYHNLLKIITKLKENKIPIILIGIKAPEDADAQYAKKLSGMYRYLAQKHSLTYYPNFLEGVAGDPRLNIEDGIHPNPRGIQVIVNNIGPFVEKMIYSITKK